MISCQNKGRIGSAMCEHLRAIDCNAESTSTSSSYGPLLSKGSSKIRTKKDGRPYAHSSSSERGVQNPKKSRSKGSMEVNGCLFSNPKGQDTESNPANRLRNLKKKLKGIQDLEKRIESGDLVNPLKEQLEKLKSKDQVEKEIVEMEKAVRLMPNPLGLRTVNLSESIRFPFLK